MTAPGLPTRGPHVFIASTATSDGSATLGGDEAHHLTTVLRVQRGAAVSVGDGAGTVWQAEVVDARAERVRLALGRRHELTPPTPRLVVVQALPKGRKLDEVVRRLVELGADRIAPVTSARSEVRLDAPRPEKALRRWRAVARAAAKQSRRAWLPEVVPVTSWAQALGDARSGVVLWERATARLGRVIDGVRDAAEVTLAVGPEGGLTEDEVAAAGLPAAALGPTILRTETASVAAAAVALHRLGRLG